MEGQRFPFPEHILFNFLIELILLQNHIINSNLVGDDYERNSLINIPVGIRKENLPQRVVHSLQIVGRTYLNLMGSSNELSVYTKTQWEVLQAEQDIQNTYYLFIISYIEIIRFLLRSFFNFE